MAISENAGSFTVPDGTVSAPGISFSGETGTGLYYDSNNSGSISISRNGTQQVRVFDSLHGGISLIGGNWNPFTDANVDFGDNSGPMAAIFSVNGTVQTSHSDFKTDIEELTYTTVPPGVQFLWKENPDRPHISWLADDLPKIAFDWDENGNIIKSASQTNAVIGILCTAVRDLQKRITNLKQELSTLQGA